jgi:hypothetical protein
LRRASYSAAEVSLLFVYGMGFGVALAGLLVSVMDGCLR